MKNLVGLVLVSSFLMMSLTGKSYASLTQDFAQSEHIVKEMEMSDLKNRVDELEYQSTLNEAVTTESKEEPDELL